MKKPIRTYDRFEIVKVPFPFVDAHFTKVRPAVVLSCATSFGGKIGMSIMAMITSAKPTQDLWPSDIIIKNLDDAGLNAPSLIRFKCFTLDHRLILGHLGNLSELDSTKVQQRLREILAI